MNRQVVFLFSLLVSLFFVFPSRSLASNILFSDNFDDGNDNGWKKVDYLGVPSSHLWKVVNGQYGARIGTSSTISDSVIDNLSWNNYIYEFDMKPKLGVDTNFIFRWKDNPSGLDYSYDVHHAFGLVWFQKLGPPAERFDPNLPTDYWPTPVNYQLTNGQTYHWKVVVNGNYIQVYITNSQGVTTKLFDFYDLNK